MKPSSLPVIGVSACFFHADPTRSIFKGKTLLYMEDSMMNWILENRAVPFMLPTPHPSFTISDMVETIDGFVLQGGSDVCPESYQEKALRPEWNGDLKRDQYEMALIHECLRQKKPILGVCRGLQILNVALGGSLYQDTHFQKEDVLVHRNWDVYDQLFHSVRIVEESKLSALYSHTSKATINSIHHQSIKELGENLVVEAISEDDGVIEAIRFVSPQQDSYAFAVQWHPEFQPKQDTHCLPREPIMNDFLQAVYNSKN